MDQLFKDQLINLWGRETVEAAVSSLVGKCFDGDRLQDQPGPYGPMKAISPEGAWMILDCLRFCRLSVKREEKA